MTKQFSTITQQRIFDYFSKHNSSKKINSKFFLLIYSSNFEISSKISDNAELNSYFMLYGLKVSKKNGNAVKRNFIKRRIKHLIRNYFHKYQPQNKFSTKHSLLVIPKKDLATANFSELNKSFENCYFKILNEINN